MVKLELKHRSIKDLNISSSPNALASFTSIKNTEVDANLNTKILGAFTSISFTLIFLYIYYTAYRRKKISLDDFTLSRSFQYCEKTISIILILLCLCIFQFFLERLNMYSNDFIRNSVVVCVYVVVTSWLLLFFIFPERTNLHSLVALLILFSTFYISFFVLNIYLKYYKESGLKELIISSRICTTIFITTLIFGMFYFITFKRNSSLSNFFRITFSILEILCLVSFSIFLYFCSLLPPLPNEDDITCFSL